MATFTNSNLTIDKFMSSVSYTEGKGTATVTKEMSNFFDVKLDFLNNTFNSLRYVVQQKTFLPNLSVKFYGTSSLWWVIARFNGIIFPLSEIEVGRALFIPQLSEISKYINQTSVTSNTSSQSKVIL